MIIKIDLVPVSQFGRRELSNHTHYYYYSPEYPRLVLSTQMQFPKLIGRISVAFVNRGDSDTPTRGDLICQQFPKAPAEWRDLSPGDLRQITLKPPPGNWRNRVQNRQDGLLPLLSELLDAEFGRTRTITPHKGGRTEKIHGFRATPEVAQALRDHLQEQSVLRGKRYSLADLIEETLRQLGLLDD